MKKLVVLTLTILLASCYSAKEVTEDFELPKGLSDCSVHQLGSTNKVIVVRCPNSQTTTVSTGKISKTTTIIEE